MIRRLKCWLFGHRIRLTDTRDDCVVCGRVWDENNRKGFFYPGIVAIITLKWRQAFQRRDDVPF